MTVGDYVELSAAARRLYYNRFLVDFRGIIVAYKPHRRAAYDVSWFEGSRTRITSCARKELRHVRGRS